MLFPLWESLALSQSEAKGVVNEFGERVCRSKARGDVVEVEIFVLEIRSTDAERSYEGLEVVGAALGGWERSLGSTAVVESVRAWWHMRLKTYKLVLLLLVATVTIVGIQGQNVPFSKSLEPIVDTLEEFMAIIRRALGSQVEGDDDEDKSREWGRHEPGDVVPVERHGDRSGCIMREAGVLWRRLRISRYALTRWTARCW
jgi:hypothetical protein